MPDNHRNHSISYFDKHGVDGIFKVILDHDVMQHQAMTAAIKNHVEKLSSRPVLTVLDLGCGPAFHIAESFQSVEAVAYTGIDNSGESLAAARRNLQGGAMPNLTRGIFLQEDFLTAMETLSRQQKDYDLALSSYAQHHLSLPDKERFFQGVYSLLKEGSCLLLFEMVNQTGTREAWLQAMEQWIVDLKVFPQRMIEESMEHIGGFDFPETIDTLQQLGGNAGFRKADLHYVLPEKEQFYSFIQFQK